MRTILACVGACLIACGSPQKEKPIGWGDPAVDPLVTQLDGIASKVSLTTDDGVDIKGTMWKGDPGAPAVVLLHQLSSDRGEWIDFVKRWAGKTTLLAIDLRGHGKSTRSEKGTIGWRMFDDKDWKATTQDVKAAVDYLRALDKPPAIIGLVGASIGSSAALLYAATDPRIGAVVMLSPGLAYRGLDTVEAVKKYGARPLLLIATKSDITSARAVKGLAAANSNATTKIYTGRRHGVLIRRDAPKMLGMVKEFLDRSLRAMAQKLGPPKPRPKAEDGGEIELDDEGDSGGDGGDAK
jgi:pimeloyl-ACP methyl ester carboxylesterase